MDWIEHDLAIGNLDDAIAYDRLREAGIESVLTLNEFPSRPRPGFEWRCEPLRDGPGNTPKRFAEALANLATLHASHPRVLVHCAEGKSRSVVIVALHLARLHGWTPEEALAHVSAHRPVALPDDLLWAQARKMFTDVHQ
jgi:atypical dual specificity phosphatase